MKCLPWLLCLGAYSPDGDAVWEGYRTLGRQSFAWLYFLSALYPGVLMLCDLKPHVPVSQAFPVMICCLSPELYTKGTLPPLSCFGHEILPQAQKQHKSTMWFTYENSTVVTVRRHESKFDGSHFKSSSVTSVVLLYSLCVMLIIDKTHL